MAIGGERNVAASTPAPTPEAEPQTTPEAEAPAEAESAQTETDPLIEAMSEAFDDEGDDLDEALGEEEVTAPESEAEAQGESTGEAPASEQPAPPSTEVPPAAVPPEAPATPQVPDQQPATPPQPSAPEQQVQPQVPPAPTMEELQQYYLQQREAALANLAGTQYALSEAEAEELGPEMADFAPRLAARVFMDATAAAMQGVMQQLPVMFQQLQQQQVQSSGYEQQFFDRWPSLSKPEYRETIMNFAQTYRQVNPGAPAEKFINDVGAQVSVALQVPVEGAAEPTPAAPAQPFQPATAAPAPKKSTAPENPFTALDREFEEEDLDLD